MRKFLLFVTILATITMLFTACNINDDIQIEIETVSLQAESESEPPTSEILLGENAHPFAVQLHKIFENSRLHRAFIVDIDGNGVEGMLVLSPSGATAALYYLYDGEIRRKHMGAHGTAHTTIRLSSSKRQVGITDNGLQTDFRLFEIYDGEVREYLRISKSTIMNHRRNSATPITIITYSYTRANGAGRALTEEEYYELLERYGLTEINQRWSELDNDDREKILAMTN